MDLERLYEFIAIAQNQSIKKAAGELNLSAATLSARFCSFEKSLGITLFERRHSSLILTRDGSRFYTDALEIISRYSSLKQELQQTDRQTFSRLRIAVAGTGLPFYLGPFLDLVNARNPQLQLDLLDDNTCSIAEGLSCGQVDLYFAPIMNRQPVPKGIIRKFIAPSQQYVLLPASHRLASHGTVSIRELNGERFILYPETCESCIRDFQLENLRASSIEYTTCICNSSSIFYMLLVPIGKGLIISPMPLMNAPPNTVCLPLTDISYTASSALFYSRGCQNPEAESFVSSFLQFTKEASHHEHRKAL
nr:LysR family transcriptional regulator [uncultured Marvinbryantia sp.]